MLPHSGILFSNKKEYVVDIWNDMVDSQTTFTEWNKPDKKAYAV